MISAKELNQIVNEKSAVVANAAIRYLVIDSYSELLKDETAANVFWNILSPDCCKGYIEGSPAIFTEKLDKALETYTIVKHDDDSTIISMDIKMPCHLPYTLIDEVPADTPLKVEFSVKYGLVLRADTELAKSRDTYINITLSGDIAAISDISIGHIEEQYKGYSTDEGKLEFPTVGNTLTVEEAKAKGFNRVYSKAETIVLEHRDTY